MGHAAYYMNNFCHPGLRKAEVWLKQNHQYIRVISHSAAGNYHGSSYCYGFSTVTILYEELGVKGMP